MVLSLPVHPLVSAEQVDYIAAKLKDTLHDIL